MFGEEGHPACQPEAHGTEGFVYCRELVEQDRTL